MSCSLSFLESNQTKSIAITENDIVITYGGLWYKINEYAKLLQKEGITKNDRVLIVGHPDRMIESIAWSYAVTLTGGSPAGASCLQSQSEIFLRLNSSKCRAMVTVRSGNITILSDVKGKQHPDENFTYFSSNTTNKENRLHSTEPGFFEYPADWTRGFVNMDTITLMQKYLGEVPLSQISSMGWEVPYAHHNVATCLMTGGTYHYTKSEAKFPELQEEYKTNCISTYPISIERISEMTFPKPIDFVEVSGGPVSSNLVRKIRSSLRPKFISNSFGTVGGSLLLARVLEKDNPPGWIETLVPWDFNNLQLRIKNGDAIGELEFSRNNSEWRVDGDIFEKLSDGSYKFKTRSHDEFLNFGGGKISTWEIEGYANDTMKDVAGCGDHTYVFPMNGLDGCDRHGLIYTGPFPIKEMKKRLDELIPYKRPQKILRVDGEFWSKGIKVSRSKMSEKIQNGKEYIIEEWQTRKEEGDL
jgi:hypothetical protein